MIQAVFGFAGEQNGWFPNGPGTRAWPTRGGFPLDYCHLLYF